MPSKITSTVLAALAGAVTVSAHGHVIKITVDGVSYDGFDPTSAPYTTPPDSIAWGNGATDNGFVTSEASALAGPDVICHLGATNAALTAPATAGSNVSIIWNTWPDSHKGPAIDYLAACDGDCATVDKTALKWFKIAELGQLSLGSGAGTVGKWADDVLIENAFTWTTQIPASIKPGNYVLRHELIALHSAGSEGQAQMYPQCFNLEISGSGAQAPEGVVGTALYGSTDPGILYNIYNDENVASASDYIIPGPKMPVFDGAASSGGSDSGAGSSEGEAPETEVPTAPAPAPSTTTLATSTSAAAPAATVTEGSSSSSVAAEPVATPSSTAVPVPEVPSAPETSSPATVSSSPAVSTPTFHCGGRKKRRSHARQVRHL